jgi:hypothetical protein
MGKSPCPALSELFATPREDRVADHLAECPRCRVLLGAAEGPPLHLRAPRRLASPSVSPKVTRVLEPGVVGLLAVAESEELLPALILESSPPLLHVAPISAQATLATDEDLLLPREVLGYAAFAALGERGSVRGEQLREMPARLPADLWTWADHLLSRVNGVDLGHEAPVGPPVFSKADPRLRWRSELAEEWEPFWRPAAVLGQAATLGELVHERREAFSVDMSELTELVDRRGWLARLEAGQLDLPAELPVSALATLLRKLQVPPLGAVLALVRTAITGSEVEVAPQGAVLARRRSSLRKASFKATEAERDAIADRYLERLRKALA